MPPDTHEFDATRRRLLRGLALLTGAAPSVLLAGCVGEHGGTGVAASGGTIRVTCTVGMVADTVRRVGGRHTEVTALMGPGVDPHLYKASQGDIDRLTGADAIFYNGLNLEGKMADILVKMAGSGKVTIPVTQSIPEELLREPPEFAGHYDPHVWFDVSLWARTIPAVVEGLTRVRPGAGAEFASHGESYAEELAELHRYCKDRLAEIPRQRRVLVTAHDAFGYFGRAYDVDVVGLQGISTISEFGIKDLEERISLIVRRGVKAVFVESSVPRRSIEALVAGCRARGHAVRIGGTLFSDAMGEAGTPEGTYPGMVRHNVETIVEALR
jgi:manganese/zinc/iron transport system substrate-binding protein